MSLIDETKHLEELMEAQAQLKHYAGIIDKIANKCHGNAAAFSRLEAERLRHQTRANAEAIKACEAEERLASALRRGDEALSEVHDLLERVEALQRVADIAHGVLLCGDLHWHTPQAERTTRERDLRDALSRLPNAKITGPGEPTQGEQK